MIKLGHRVFIRSIKRKGSVEYIDVPRLSLQYFYPVQIRLDRPYGECDQMIYRTHPQDLKRVGKGKKDVKPKGKVMPVIWVDEVTEDLTKFYDYLNSI